MILPIASCAAWLVIEIMVLINPSGNPPLTNFQNYGTAFFILTLSTAFALPFQLLHIRSKKLFLVFFGLSLSTLIAMTWTAGSRFHRDFHTYSTQIIVIYLSLFLFRIDSMNLVKNRNRTYSLLSKGMFILFALWMGWLMMMAYALVTRAEPRWIEATGYNLINMIIAVILFFTAAMLQEQQKRNLRYADETLFLENRNISEILSAQENRLVLAFLHSTGLTGTCDSLLTHIRSDIEEHQDCSRCRTENLTASNCSTYRTLKNRITHIKRYLELLQIGTIVPVSENPRSIKESGWRLRLFDDVKLK